MSVSQKRALRFLVASILLALLLAGFFIDTSPSRHPATEASDLADPSRRTGTPALSEFTQRRTSSFPPGARSPLPQPTGAFRLDELAQAPDGPAAGVLQQLTPLALSGDANAALKLYMTLSRCEEALHQPSDLDRLSELMTADDMKILKAKQLAMELDCATVASELKSRGRWLELAAQAGDLQAQLLYSVDAEALLGTRRDILKNPDAVKQYRDRATGYLKSLAARGSIDAMLQLSSTYESGVLLERNDVLALAYLQAASFSDPDAAYLDLSAPIKARLSHLQQAQAMRFAKDLHQSCCDELGGRSTR